MTAPARLVPHTIGETRAGNSVIDRDDGLDAGTKIVSAFPVTAQSQIVKLSLCCDMAGVEPGDAQLTDQVTLRGVVYVNGSLVACGTDVVLPAFSPMQWVDLPILDGPAFAPNADGTINHGGISVPAGTVELGCQVGGTQNVFRVACFDPDPPSTGSRWNPDPFADGIGNPFATIGATFVGRVPFLNYIAGVEAGDTASLTATMSIYATTIDLWTPNENTPASVLAKLGWDDAQRFLFGGLDKSLVFDSTSMWHGTGIDPNRGAFAVVRAAGPLSGLVGRTLKITSKAIRPRSCYVYVTASVATLDEDISLSRRAFAALELLSADTIGVRVEVVA